MITYELKYFSYKLIAVVMYCKLQYKEYNYIYYYYSDIIIVDLMLSTLYVAEVSN